MTFVYMDVRFNDSSLMLSQYGKAPLFRVSILNAT
jgi:hypothetical protein